MLDQTPMGVAVALLRAVERVDIAEVRRLLDDDATVFHPMFGDGGKREYLQLLEGVSELMTNGITFEMVGSTVQDDRVALEVRGRAELGNGQVYRNAYCYQFRIRDGRVVSMAEYADTAPATAAFAR